MGTERHFAADADTGDVVGHVDLKPASSCNSDVVSMPRALTAENGAKALLIGDFFSEVEQDCPRCFGECVVDGETCQDCSGEGSFTLRVPVSWTTIKEIYAKAVEHLASPSSTNSATDYETVVDAIARFFEGEYFCIGRTVSGDCVQGAEQDPTEEFDKVFVSQGGGGFTGDDFHGTAYFHIGNGRYATAEY